MASEKHDPIFGAYPTYAEAHRAVERLVNEGIPQSRISVMMGEEAHGLAVKKERATGEGAIAGGALGAIMGGVAAVASLAVPGGILIAGPLGAALGGGAAGLAGGGLVGALIGAGVPEHHAKKYANDVARHGYLISVHPETMRERATAKAILRSSVRMEPRDSQVHESPSL